MRKILLSALLLAFLSMAFPGMMGTTKLPSQLRISAVAGHLLHAPDRAKGTESHGRGSNQCGEVLPGDSGYVMPSELKNTNVGAMLGRAGEEDILKPVTICENYKPTKFLAD